MKSPNKTMPSGATARKRNAAGRVLDHLERVPQAGTQNDAFIKALPVLCHEALAATTDPTRRAAKLSELLLAQIDAIEIWLGNQGFPADAYQRQLKKVRQAFSPGVLTGSWSHVLQHVTEDVLVAFRWATFAMDDEGDGLDLAAVDTLVAAIRDILDDPLVHRLPRPIRRILESNLAAVVDALASYHLLGKRPVEEAAEDLMAAIVVAAEEIAEAEVAAPEETKPLLGKAKAVVGKVVDVVLTTGKVAEAIDKMHTLYGKAPALIECAEKAIKLLKTGG